MYCIMCNLQGFSFFWELKGSFCVFQVRTFNARTVHCVVMVSVFVCLWLDRTLYVRLCMLVYACVCVSDLQFLNGKREKNILIFT